MRIFIKILWCFADFIAASQEICRSCLNIHNGNHEALKDVIFALKSLLILICIFKRKFLFFVQAYYIFHYICFTKLSAEVHEFVVYSWFLVPLLELLQFLRGRKPGEKIPKPHIRDRASHSKFPNPVLASWQILALSESPFSKGQICCRSSYVTRQ